VKAREGDRGTTTGGKSFCGKVVNGPPSRATRNLEALRAALMGLGDDVRFDTPGKLLRILAQHLLDAPDPNRQTEALK
jgi:hypothetical protein